MAEKASKSILVIHGPNLNLLGFREPHHYGTLSLNNINESLKEIAQKADVKIETYQSNSESDIIEKLHSLTANGVDFIIINPAAFTHTSVAIRDAISAIKVPFVEVHLSNVYSREPFRHHSYFSDIAVGVISGLGADGYLFALDFAIRSMRNRQQTH